MSKWEKVRLGDVATVVSGSTPKTSVKEYWNGHLNWITPAELQEDIHIVYETQRKITEKAVMDTGLNLLPRGTVLLSSRAPIGKVAIAGVEMYCNQGFKNLVCSEKLYNQYLFWFLKRNTEFLNSLGRGATFKEISKSIVENIQIPLPPLSVQQKIANDLNLVSELIKIRKQQLFELDNLIKSFFYELFGLQEKCDEKPLIDIIVEGAGLSYGIVQPGEDVGTGVGIIRPIDIKDGEISYDDIKRVPPHIEEPYKRTRLSGNEILITVRGSTGDTALTDERCQGMNVTRGIAVIRQNDEIVNRVYLNQYLRSEQSQKYIQQNTKGATLKQLNLSALKKMLIPLPPLELQNKFADIVAKIEEQKALVKKAVDETQLLFDSLMSQYFDGS